ncbi:LacI family DNA-binding transcriptional regulator [Coraliomargarita parva]|uniref:LacI family DNA-binding transcriptional regulator n=1 Tax=Coraliomargarita parva TaxID=3014050 RepID=UPI0022B52CA0|nr:LacI family DNA-binding transcriptional regulator [Coraliomargarita parva]
MASLKDIANELGVSNALVSRVLSNRMGTTRVSEKTRQAILAKAKELDYEPNPLAVALKKGRKGVVGVFLHGVGSPGSEIALNCIKAAGRALSGAGINMWLELFDSDAEFRAVCDVSILRKVDGLFVAGAYNEDLLRSVNTIVAHGLPVTMACHEDVREVLNLVNFTVDNELLTYLPTRHLLDLGCRRIAQISCGNEARLAGYERAHRDAGITPDPALTITTDEYSTEQGIWAMEQLLDSGLAFDGVCAHSDAHAAGAYKSLVLGGVPREQWPKMTGVDDSPIARHLSMLPLTSSTSELARCCELGVEALVKMIEGETCEAEVVRPRLKVRQSTLG